MAQVIISKASYKSEDNKNDVRAALQSFTDWQGANLNDCFHCHYANGGDGCITWTTAIKPDAEDWETQGARYKDYPHMADLVLIKQGINADSRHVTCGDESKANKTVEFFKKEYPEMKFEVVVAEVNLADYPENKFTWA